MTSHLLTVEQTAEYAGVVHQTVRRWIKEEGLKAQQPAGPHGAVRIDRRDLAAFLSRDSHQRLAAKVRVHAAKHPNRVRKEIHAGK